MKLTHIISEIGEGSSKPYSYTLSKKKAGGGWIDYTYGFTMEGDWVGMVLLTHLIHQSTLSIDFDVRPKSQSEVSYEMTNLGLGPMFRIMSTIIHILKGDIPKRIEEPIYTLSITPVKSKTSKFAAYGDEQRIKLYNTYIRKHVKVKRIKSTPFGTDYELQAPIQPK